MGDRAVKVSEAIQIIGLPKLTVYKLIRTGEIPSERAINGVIYVRESEARRIRAWFDGEPVVE